MNFFFGIKNKYLNCEIKVPIFKNNGEINYKLKLFSCEINDKRWLIKKLDLETKNNFFFVKNNQIDKNKIYFLAEEKNLEIKTNENSFFFIELKKFNNFTNTEPQYRSNLKVFNDLGFSSYQSDYPFNMIEKKGSVLSPIYPLLNSLADKNFIFFRNIYKMPIHKEFQIFFIDIEKKAVLHKEQVITNKTNEIEINKSLINENVYMFSDKYVGIPIFISIKDKNISMEHTHPPHHYIISKDKYHTVRNIKEKINEIIN